MKFKKQIMFTFIKLVGKFSIRTAILMVRLLPRRYHNLILLNSNLTGKFKIKAGSQELVMRLGSEDDHFIQVAKNEFNRWENQSLNVWEKAIKRGSTVLDIGAYLGIFSLLAEKAGAEKVYAFEPNPHTREKLAINNGLNNAEKIQVIAAACGSKSGMTYMENPSGRDVSSGTRVMMSDSESTEVGWSKSFLTELVVVDEILSNEEIRNVSAIKIDVEGFEIEVLRGCINILRTSRPQLVLEILSQREFTQICSFLLANGYSEFAALDVNPELIFFTIGVNEPWLEYNRNFLFR